MIYQSGYLTIKDYDRRRKTFLLDFPNNEVKNGFLTMVAASYLNTNEDVSNLAQDLDLGLMENAEMVVFPIGLWRERIYHCEVMILDIWI